MNSQLSLALAQSRQQDMLRAAAQARLAGTPRRTSLTARLGRTITPRRPQPAATTTGQLANS